MLKGIIFDMDGVLIDSVVVIKEVFEEFARSIGLELDPDDSSKTKGMSLRDKLAHWKKQYGYEGEIDWKTASWHTFQIERSWAPS